MPKAYPKEFREDVVRVARNREDGMTVKQIAKDFGISESCLTNWLMKADVQDGNRPNVSSSESGELRELRRRNRLLEQWGSPRLRGRTRCFAARRRTSRRRTCRENDVPARA